MTNANNRHSLNILNLRLSRSDLLKDETNRKGLSPVTPWSSYNRPINGETQARAASVNSIEIFGIAYDQAGG
jgi:hypothetical protein